jgi:hypothetical protein
MLLLLVISLFKLSYTALNDLLLLMFNQVLLRQFVSVCILPISSLLIPATSGLAQSNTVLDQCATTLRAVESQLEQGQSLEVEIRQFDSSNSSNAAYPEGRPIAYTLRLIGNSAADVMHSPQMMQAISTRIIESCDMASSVTFNVAPSGWHERFGLIDGAVARFQCWEMDFRRMPAWGYINCSV